MAFKSETQEGRSMSNSSSKGTALITGASRGIGAVHPVEVVHLQSSLSYILPDSRPKGTQ
jgi:hypothetical protein